MFLSPAKNLAMLSGDLIIVKESRVEKNEFPNPFWENIEKNARYHQIASPTDRKDAR